MGDRTPDEIGALDVRTRGAVSGVASLNASKKVVEEPASKGLASGVASLNASSLVIENPANSTVTPTAGKIPIADGSGKLDGWVTVALTKGFESAEQTITAAGALTLAHGLGVEPKLFQVMLVCKTAESGYSINDKVSVASGASYAGGANARGVSIVPDTTNLNVRFGAETGVFQIANKSSGVLVGITNANWKAVFRAWA